MRERVVQGANGIRLRCVEWGSSDASPVILLHGLGSDANSWDAVAPELARDRWVIAPDARGLGKSDRANEYSFELMRDDVVALLDDFDIAQIAVVGASMGGSVAFSFAASHPDRLERLVIVDTPPPRISWSFPELPDQKPAGSTFVGDWRVAVSLTKQLNDADTSWWDALPRIGVPTLIIGGGSTSHVDQSELAEVADLIPDSRLVTFEGAGHNVHATMPDEFLSVVKPFLRGEEIPVA